MQGTATRSYQCHHRLSGANRPLAHYFSGIHSASIPRPAWLPNRRAAKFGIGAIFHAERRCLLGIISQKVPKYNYRRQYGRLQASAAGYAGYFVPVSAIVDFIPPEFPFDSPACDSGQFDPAPLLGANQTVVSHFDQASDSALACPAADRRSSGAWAYPLSRLYRQHQVRVPPVPAFVGQRRIFSFASHKPTQTHEETTSHTNCTKSRQGQTGDFETH